MRFLGYEVFRFLGYEVVRFLGCEGHPLCIVLKTFKRSDLRPYNLTGFLGSEVVRGVRSA